MRTKKSLLMGVMMAVMVVTVAPAHAGIVGTEQMVTQPTRVESLNRIDQALAGEEVAAQLEAWGVAKEQVAERVAALSDIELAELANTIETDPAGGVLVVVGVVFVVLMILEFTGVINIFR